MQTNTDRIDGSRRWRAVGAGRDRVGCDMADARRCTGVTGDAVRAGSADAGVTKYAPGV